MSDVWDHFTFLDSVLYWQKNIASLFFFFQFIEIIDKTAYLGCATWKSLKDVQNDDLIHIHMENNYHSQVK